MTQPPRRSVITSRITPRKTPPSDDLREFVKSGLSSDTVKMEPAAELPSMEEINQVTAHQREALQAELRQSPAAPMTPLQTSIQTAVRLQQDPPATLDGRFQRLDLPSRELPYLPVSGVFGRKISWTEYGKLYAALRAQSTTALLDALTTTCSIPVRDLVVADYKYFLVWHRINSFLKSPLTVTWNSIYGDRVESQVSKTILTDTKLAMPQEEFQHWKKDLGITLPTAREIEFFEAVAEEGNLPDDEYALLLSAQWLDPNFPAVSEYVAQVSEDHPYRSLQGRVLYLKAQDDLDLLFMMKDFQTAVDDLGVKESIRVTNDQFEPQTALQRLQLILDADKQTPGVIGAGILEKAASELSRIRQALDAKQPVRPMEEEVPLSFSAWSMFPIDIQ